MEKLQLKIISPEKTLFNGSVHIVQLPGVEGTFSILHNHAPLIVALKKGDIVYQTDQQSEQQKIAIDSGFIELHNNVATVCAEQNS